MSASDRMPSAMRLGCDTGGTFTDLVVEESDGSVTMYKASTTPGDPSRGVLAALELAAADRGELLSDFLSRADMLVHGTTHAINAIITGNTARTAFLVTQGHPDILVLREGGRAEPFDHTVPFPEPYVPRSQTFEVPERIGADGRVIKALDEAAVCAVLDELEARRIEAIAVCLLWSIANPAHERRIGELIATRLPGVPVTLSHQLSPALREYWRASATCIDASLKPLMGVYLAGLEGRLREAGFRGRLLVLTSQGGMVDSADLARTPIHAINSGPSAAPIAGHHFATLEGSRSDVIVADTGGTTYDVGLVRNGRVPWTRETWIGPPYRGHMTGFPSVDVKSVGAGGGSIAWVDEGQVLHVGPQSAGAVPGPICYGRGGQRPTLTDACVVLGYIDPDYFLGGSMRLQREAAEQAIDRQIAQPLRLSLFEAAAAIVELATENMVQAIADITINQGIDPAQAILLGGGGAAGLNCVAVARRLNCRNVLIPELGAALSAAGALMTDLAAEYRAVRLTTSMAFDYAGVAATLAALDKQCRNFLEAANAGRREFSIEFTVEARYPGQVWEIEVPLAPHGITTPDDLRSVLERFHAEHRTIFAIDDPHSPIEMVSWTAKARCALRNRPLGRLVTATSSTPKGGTRLVYFTGRGRVRAALHRLDALPAGHRLAGPAIVESPFTTIVIDPDATFERTGHGSLMVTLGASDFSGTVTSPGRVEGASA
jgi:N-methylhydantoinase A